MGTTENEVIRQYLDSHWREIADYIGSRQKDASEVELIAYDPDRIVGLLCNYVWQGVRKVVRVTPSSLLEGLLQLDDELRQRCINAAEDAERAASYAKSQGDYAKGQGDRVVSLIEEITELKARVAEQGRTAESQGNAAYLQMEAVRSWFTPFSASAESWFSGISADVANWFNSRKSQWADWFTNGIVRDWNSFWQTATEDFRLWTSAENTRKDNENERQEHEAIRLENELQRVNSECERTNNERERVAQEEIRLDGTYRQNIESGNWERLNQRTGEWEDTGNSWQGGLLAYRFYTNWKTGRIHVVKNTLDKVVFSIKRGRLKAKLNE